LIFILSYDRSREKLIENAVFDDDDVRRAQEARLVSEARHAGHDDVEVVLLRSDSIDELHRTHSRYFQSAQQIADGLRERLARR
jgi:hypothetical protein